MKNITYEEGFSKYIRKDGKVTLSEFKRWRVRIVVNGKRINKSFMSEVAAIKYLNNHHEKA